MSYDVKYRQRALSYLSEGNSFRKTAEVFKVSTSTLQAWKSQLNETGTLTPKKRETPWRKIDPEKLRKYVEEHPDAYQHEMATAFGVRRYAIQQALKRLQITRKKNHALQGNKHTFEERISCRVETPATAKHSLR